MPLYKIDKPDVSLVKQSKFKSEKELQALIEKNLKTIFNCSFVATEFVTGPVHAGRIDTLALSEDNNPVIIEYKIVESSDLINQSLFYLSWMNDHRGDFQVLVNKSLGNNVEVDWSDIRVICIAPGYKKYDLHAVKMMGANIELWEYKLYENSSIYLEEIFRKSTSLTEGVKLSENGKNPVFVEAGKKAAMTRASGSYTFEEHLKKVDGELKEIVKDIKSFILDIDEAIEEVPKKFYVAYKVTQNFVCMEVQKNKIILFLKINPDDIDTIPTNARDVREIGHYGTGDFEYAIKKREDFENSKEYILLSYKNIGG